MPSAPFPGHPPIDIWEQSLSVRKPSRNPSDNFREGWHAAAEQLQAMYPVHAPLLSYPPHETWTDSLSANQASFGPMFQFQEGWHAYVKQLQHMFPVSAPMHVRQDPSAGVTGVRSYLELMDDLAGPKIVMLDDSVVTRGKEKPSSSSRSGSGNKDSHSPLRIFGYPWERNHF